MTTPGSGLDGHPAQDVDAEQTVLGCMLRWQHVVADILDIIAAADFYRPAHQIIFEAIRDLFARGDPCDVIAVNKRLAETGQSAKTGGGAYLHTLVTMAPAVPAQATYYAEIVAEHAIHRRVTEAGYRIARLGETPGIPAGGARHPGARRRVEPHRRSRPRHRHAARRASPPPPWTSLRLSPGAAPGRGQSSPGSPTWMSCSTA